MDNHRDLHTFCKEKESKRGWLKWTSNIGVLSQTSVLSNIGVQFTYTSKTQYLAECMHQINIPSSVHDNDNPTAVGHQC